MKENICFFTGHRTIPANEYATIQKRLGEEITNLIHQGVTEFRTGGALGFDTMAALAVLRLRDGFPHIRLMLILPCEDQTKGWSHNNRAVFLRTLCEADELVLTSKRYYKGCMHKRNRYMVENSNICICYLTKDSGGTAYTVDYARQKGLTIINLAQS